MSKGTDFLLTLLAVYVGFLIGGIGIPVLLAWVFAVIRGVLEGR